MAVANVQELITQFECRELTDEEPKRKLAKL